MSYTSTVKTAEQATKNIVAGLKSLAETDVKRTRIVSSLGINLADYISFSEQSSQTFDNAKAQLRELIKTVVPTEKNAKGEDVPEQAAVGKLMSSAQDAVKIAMLLINPNSGFTAGYVRNDSRAYVSAETYAGMNKDAKAKHSPEVFWNRSMTFPKVKLGQDPVDSPTSLLLPTVSEMQDAYKVHFLNAEVDGHKIKSAERQNGEDVIDTPKKAVAAIAKLTAYLKDDNLLAVNDKTLKVFSDFHIDLETAIDKRLMADKEADVLEKLEERKTA